MLIGILMKLLVKTILRPSDEKEPEKIAFISCIMSEELGS